MAVTHALGGLFCAGLGPSDEGETVRTFGHIYPPNSNSNGRFRYSVASVHRNSDSRLFADLTHFLLAHPSVNLCTENLTPFLSLLPSKGLSGLSSLLAQPGIVFSWGFKAEGIEVIMPSASSPQGRWRGWWEGVVDLVPERGVSRAFSTRTLFKKGLPRPFPEAESSVLRMIMPGGRSLRMDPSADQQTGRWIDGRLREVRKWDLLDGNMVGQDVRFWWEDEMDFTYREFRRSVDAPSIYNCL